MPLTISTQPPRSGRTTAFVMSYALLMGLYAILPTWKEYSTFKDYGDTSSQIHAAFSVVLGWLLVFRTNTAYNRWWEARTLWGALVNASRNASIKFCTLGKLSAVHLSNARLILSAFPVALRCQLREEVDSKLPQEIRDLAGNYRHVAQGLVARLYGIATSAKAAQEIDGDELRILDVELLRFLEITGGCERIQKTRIVKSYRVFARQCVWVFLLTFPWGIVNDFAFWTIPITVLISYFMIGLEVVAEHVEEPFGYDEDDLDLDGLCITIARSVNEVFENRGK